MRLFMNANKHFEIYLNVNRYISRDVVFLLENNEKIMNLLKKYEYILKFNNEQKALKISKELIKCLLFDKDIKIDKRLSERELKLIQFYQDNYM